MQSLHRRLSILHRLRRLPILQRVKHLDRQPPSEPRPEHRMQEISHRQVPPIARQRPIVMTPSRSRRLLLSALEGVAHRGIHVVRVGDLEHKDLVRGDGLGEGLEAAVPLRGEFGARGGLDEA